MSIIFMIVLLSFLWAPLVKGMSPQVLFEGLIILLLGGEAFFFFFTF